MWDNVYNLHVTSSSLNYIVAKVQLVVGQPAWNLVLLCLRDFNIISSQFEKMWGEIGFLE